MDVKKHIGVAEFQDEENVKVKRCGNVTSIATSPLRAAPPCFRLDKDHYFVVSSGEVVSVHHNESRASDLRSVSHSLAFGRDMLNTNITDVSSCRWMTLTYAENMQDPQRLVYDFQNFNRRCRSVFGQYEYITAAEPQARGAWHLHVVLIFPGKAPFMPNDVVSKLWRHGFVTIKRLDDVDNVGAYLSAYLGDYELLDGENTDVPDDRVKTVEYEENGEKKSKRYIKGGRLYMYPPGFHIFRFSKGLKKPDISVMPYSQAKREKASFGELTFCESMDIVSESFRATLNYAYYNKLRKKSQDPR